MRPFFWAPIPAAKAEHTVWEAILTTPSVAGDTAALLQKLDLSALHESFAQKTPGSARRTPLP